MKIVLTCCHLMSSQCVYFELLPNIFIVPSHGFKLVSILLPHFKFVEIGWTKPVACNDAISNVQIILKKI